MDNKFVSSTEFVNTLANHVSNYTLKRADMLSEISSKIVLERLSRGMNQKQFAEFLGVSQGMVSRWENGDYNFTIETLAKIFTDLNIDIDISFDAAYESLNNKIHQYIKKTHKNSSIYYGLGIAG